MAPSPSSIDFDDVITQDQDLIGLDLGGEMAVADMPGKAGEVNGIATANRQQFLVRRDDLGVAAVLEHKHVAVLEHQRLAKSTMILSPWTSVITLRRTCRSSCGRTATSNGSWRGPSPAISAARMSLGVLIIGNFRGSIG